MKWIKMTDKGQDVWNIKHTKQNAGASLHFSPCIEDFVDVRGLIIHTIFGSFYIN